MWDTRETQGKAGEQGRGPAPENIAAMRRRGLPSSYKQYSLLLSRVIILLVLKEIRVQF